jgi:opacity protein-like surface antigen
MKKSIFTLLLVLITLNVKAQEETKKGEFGIIMNGKLGFAKLKQSGEVQLNGNVNAGETQFYYSLPSGTYFTLGIGLLEFNTNGVSGGENYSLEQNYIRIPMYINKTFLLLKEQLNNKVNAYGGVGIYGNTLLKEELKTLSQNFELKNQGWNLGFGLNFGMLFEIYDETSLGIGFESQSDITKMNKNGMERKLESINTFNFIFKWNL